MTDYYSVIIKAIEALPEDNAQVRSGVYARARNALIGRLRAIDPPLNEADITRQRLALERAIRRVENELASAHDHTQSMGKPTSTNEAPLSRENGQPVKNNGDEAPKQVTVAPAGEAPIITPPINPEPEAPKKSPSELTNEILSGFPEKLKQPPSRQMTPKQPSLTAPGASSQPKPGLNVGTNRRRTDNQQHDARIYRLLNRLLVPVIGVLLILIAVMVFQYRQSIRDIFGVNDVSDTQLSHEAKPETLKPETLKPNVAAPDIEDLLNGNNNRPDTQADTTTEDTASDKIDSLETNKPRNDIVDLLSKLPSQQAAYFEEVKGEVGTKRIDGSVNWRLSHATETDVAPYQIEADIKIEEAGIIGKLVISQSLDETAALTHTIRVSIETNEKASGGGIREITGLLAKRELNGEGEVFDALQRQIAIKEHNALLLGLSASDQGRVHNADLLRSFESLDILLVLKNNRKVIIAIERGDSGSKVVNTALNYWR